jgi:hypothetical protein
MLAVVLGTSEFEHVTLHYAVYTFLATVKWHPQAHHPLDACYYSVVDEPQLS